MNVSLSLSFLPDEKWHRSRVKSMEMKKSSGRVGVGNRAWCEVVDDEQCVVGASVNNVISLSLSHSI